MEINKYLDIVGVVTMDAYVEGRFGVFDAHGLTQDFGSWADLPGFRVPVSAEEATRAAHVLTWAVDNRQYPLFQPVPSMTWALRQGFDRTQSLPITTASIYLTPPGNQEEVTIPSGMPALAFGMGTYTMPSGSWVHTAAMQTPGCLVQVCNYAEDTTDAGKIKSLTTNSYRRVGLVRYYNPANDRLTIEIDR